MIVRCHNNDKFII